MKKLLERERELAAVETLVKRGGGILVVERRAGISKTSLVEAACQRAKELGHKVLRARGSELEADFAFGVVRQLFERRLAGADVDEREALLVGPRPQRGRCSSARSLRRLPMTPRLPSCTACTGWPPISHPFGRCCLPSMTRIGRTSPHFAGWHTSRRGSMGWRWH